VLLALSSLLIVAFLPWIFFATLAAYYVITLAYSLWAKERVVLDILFLTGLYTMRLIAGAVATAIDLSFWLLAFSVFLFLSLALTKRYAEMLAARNAGQKKAAGRGYHIGDMPLLQSMGVASGYMAVLVLALYINSPDVRQMYAYPKVLWALCIVLLFWINRVWIKTDRGEMHDDPVVFAAKDRVSQITALIVAVALWVAV
jgi:4-hydroxybenzoate polyprenyltransferase